MILRLSDNRPWVSSLTGFSLQGAMPSPRQRIFLFRPQRPRHMSRLIALPIRPSVVESRRTPVNELSYISSLHIHRVSQGHFDSQAVTSALASKVAEGSILPVVDKQSCRPENLVIARRHLQYQERGDHDVHAAWST